MCSEHADGPKRDSDKLFELVTDILTGVISGTIVAIISQLPRAKAPELAEKQAG